ncbi:MAG TPA: AtpZ/AtpI family protein [Aquihabitans sp.]|jgi:hypothetical protein|nr:AtpZ/AtpI family protein [Aquihabitans sp.]
MPDPDSSAPGDAAPAGPADAPLQGPAVGPAARPRAAGTKRLEPIKRIVLATAGGTAVNPLDREGYAVATNRGYGDAMGRGFELALTLAAMTGIGWLLDRWAGTEPIFTLVLGVIGFVGISVKLWIGYDLEMRKHEAGAVWNRGRGDAADHDLTRNRRDDLGGETMAS